MNENLSKENVTESLRIFRSRRDDLLHEDVAAFDHHLQRFVEFCRTDPLVQTVLNPIRERIVINVEEWWKVALNHESRVTFPSDPDEELLLRFGILERVFENASNLHHFGFARGVSKYDDCIGLFRTILIRPFVEELSHRLADAANLASPDARALQAVPLNRIPIANEIKIFLSHKTVDKPLVYRYYYALKEVGFTPWLDEPNMAAGANLERELFRGFEESCAAVFFITENFKDEMYLAAEVEYAVMQKRKKVKKFAIITLRYSNAAPVPHLLTPYIYKDIESDLHGFYELVR
ncbi:MAG: toll/interleukin-1 receptor domain-containing protein, partial [Candidatus Omnitrophota bacterium]